MIIQDGVWCVKCGVGDEVVSVDRLVGTTNTRSLRDDGRQPSRRISKLPFEHGDSTPFDGCRNADDVVIVRLEGMVSVTRCACAGKSASVAVASHGGIMDMLPCYRQ
jgi:hypothetical protein